MSDPDWDGLGTYVRSLADLIGLREWTFIIEREPADDGCEATVYPTEFRRQATLHVSGAFWDYAPDRQRQGLIHELLHCHHAGASDLVRVDLVRELGQSAYHLFEAAFRRATEYWVDCLATAIAGGFPPPPWVKGEEHAKDENRGPGAGQIPA